MPTTPLISVARTMIIYIDDVTTIVRGIAVRIAPEVVPLRLQQSEMNKQVSNNRTSKHSEHGPFEVM